MYPTDGLKSRIQLSDNAATACMKMAGDKLHAAFGASASERGWECPGWVQLAPTCPPAPPSRYAAEGTVAHTVAASILEFQRDDGPEPDLNRTYEEQGFDFVVDDEMIENVAVYTSYVLGRVAEYNLFKHQWAVETRVVLTGISCQCPTDTGEEPTPEVTEDGTCISCGLPVIDLFGTADFIAHVPYDRLIVLDFKYGQGVLVDVAENKQGLYYALGAYYRLSAVDREELDTIEIGIVQPRASWKGGGIKTWECSVQYLLDWEKQLLAAARRIAAKDTTLNAGDWCRFCPAKPICPALRTFSTELTQLDFASVPAVLPKPSEVPEHIVLAVLRNADMLKSYIDSYEDYVHGALTNGTASEALKEEWMLTPREGHRAYLDKEAATDVFEKLLGDKAYKKTLHTPAQMEKALGAAKVKTSNFHQLVHKPIKGTKLARVGSGKPEAVKRDITEDFIDVKAV